MYASSIKKLTAGVSIKKILYICLTIKIFPLSLFLKIEKKCTELDLLKCGRFRILNVFEGRIFSIPICDIKLCFTYTELNTMQ